MPARENLPGRERLEVRVQRKKIVHDIVVLLAQQTTGGVHQPPVGFHQRGGGREDFFLVGGERGQVDGAPLDVRVAPERAGAGAGRVDQHAVDLAGQPPDAFVIFMGDGHGPDVLQAGAFQPRLEFLQALG